MRDVRINGTKRVVVNLFSVIYYLLVYLRHQMNEKRIVLFGLSANPPTGLGGHMGIVRYFSSISV